MRLADQADRVVAIAETMFGKRVLRIRAPGGKSRGSLRIEFADRTVIASVRGGDGRTGHEARVLAALSPHTDAVPRFLGQSEGLMFQSDVGSRRLGQHIRTCDAAGQEQLALDAIRALFDIHRAARAGNLMTFAPQLGATPDWVENMLQEALSLPRMLGQPTPELDLAAAAAFIGTPRRQFIKWDARSGNAAVDDAGAVRWFDFEYSGLRHGAEEFAWLVADEVWPLGPDRMLPLIGDAFDDPDMRWDDYRAYLEVFASFHAAIRLTQILDRVHEKGWTDIAMVIRFDRIGRNPILAGHLADGAAWLADRHPLTRPMVEMFERVSVALAATIMPPDGPRQV